jgi:hypothetical protein
LSFLFSLFFERTLFGTSLFISFSLFFFFSAFDFPSFAGFFKSDFFLLRVDALLLFNFCLVDLVSFCPSLVSPAIVVLFGHVSACFFLGNGFFVDFLLSDISNCCQHRFKVPSNKFVKRIFQILVDIASVHSTLD